MTACVYYHHPEDEQYSLAYVTTDTDDISANDDNTRVEQYHLNETVYVLYTNNGTSGTVDDIDDEFDTILREMNAENRLITMRFLQLFEGIISEKEIEDGEKLKIYKKIELERVPNAVEHIDWHTSVIDVAGQLMSTLVLKHVLPNANHRTSIAMAEWYLESADLGFSFPEMATMDNDWMNWVNSYITESKRLLTVRRNTTAFNLLDQWGCNTINLKNGIEIDISEFELNLDRSKALAIYANQHTDLCTEFMRDSVKRAEHDYLIDERGPDKKQFITYLENVE